MELRTPPEYQTDIKPLVLPRSNLPSTNEVIVLSSDSEEEAEVKQEIVKSPLLVRPQQEQARDRSPTAPSTADPPSTTLEEDEAALKRFFAQQTKGRVFCSVCGFEFQVKNATTVNRHRRAHCSHPSGAACSICGVRASNHKDRNSHEKHRHGFERFAEDKSEKRAVRVSNRQLRRVFNTGHQFVRVQSKARRSQHRSDDRKDQKASLGSVRRVMLQQPKKITEIKCSICGCRVKGKNFVQQHEEKHDPAFGPYRCSVCGVFAKDYAHRNQHERRAHQFYRQKYDVRRLEAIAISPQRFTKLRNLGLNFADVQQTAVPPATGWPSIEVPYEEEDEEEEEENDAEEDSWSDSSEHSAAGQTPSLQRRLDDDWRLVADPTEETEVTEMKEEQKDADGEEEEEQLFGQPSSSNSRVLLSIEEQIARLARDPVQRHEKRPPVRVEENSTNEEQRPNARPEPRFSISEVDRLLVHLTLRMPAVLFFDYAALHSTYSTAPICLWLADERSRLLLVRTRTANWTGEPQLLTSFHLFSHPLNESAAPITRSQTGDFVLCFAKAAAGDAARRLMDEAESGHSLREFAAVLAAFVSSNEQTALFVGRVEESEQVEELESNRFEIW